MGIVQLEARVEGGKLKFPEDVGNGWHWVDLDSNKSLLDNPKSLWHPLSQLGSFMIWLEDRGATEDSSWIEDMCKYVNISFDSRVGSFIVRSDNYILLYK